MRFNLEILKTRLGEDVAELTSLAIGAAGKGDIERIAISEYCVIQLQDSWNRFVRDLILKSSSGNSIRSGGARIGPGSRGQLTQRQSRTLLASSWSSRRGMGSDWEPAWTSQQEANRAIDILGPQNGNDLKTAIGASTNPIAELKPVRNFAAHRGPVSSAKMEAISRVWGKPWCQPSDLFLDDGVGLFRFDEWCRRFQAVANAAVM